jgi:hypothetical protein
MVDACATVASRSTDHEDFMVYEEILYPIKCLIANPEPVIHDLIQDLRSTVSKAADKVHRCDLGPVLPSCRCVF